MSKHTGTQDYADYTEDLCRDQGTCPACPQVECIDSPGHGSHECAGPVEPRLPLSGTGRSFPRCDGHWEQRKEREQELRGRYPEHPPTDWSPDDAGEAWGEEDY